MRSLRVRFTILGLMLAVAVVALLLTLAVRMHPQPVRVTILGPKGYVITWSDGSKTNLGPDADLPRCNGGEPFAFGFLRRVEWYDGTWNRITSYTWHTSWPWKPIPKPPPNGLGWSFVDDLGDLTPSSTLTNRVWPPSPAVDSEKQGAFADRTA